MMVVVAYDISTKDAAGRRRLRKVSGKCADWGVPVQHSVYECQLNAEQFQRFRKELSSLIHTENDSVRLYLLGNHFQSRVDYLGRDTVSWDRQTFVI